LHEDDPAYGIKGAKSKYPPAVLATFGSVTYPRRIAPSVEELKAAPLFAIDRNPPAD
jgi:hypothetical protein